MLIYYIKNAFKINNIANSPKDNKLWKLIKCTICITSRGN